MAGNTFGSLFSLTTFGESHGDAIGCIVDGMPAGMPLTTEDIQQELNRRRPGQSKYTTSRQEADHVQILSGVFEGKTTGVSIGLLIQNTDKRPKDYDELKHKFRPGHADYVYQQKYGIRDYRGGGRSSARETALWVAAGAIAKKYLKMELDVSIYGYLCQMGTIKCDYLDGNFVNNNPFFCADPGKIAELKTMLTATKEKGDSLGAKIRVIAENVPLGLGQPVFNKLNANLAQAFMLINAVKGVEIGDGFAVVERYGSQYRDEMTSAGFLSNHAGGIVGGISTGQPIIATIAFKPTSSILISGCTINDQGQTVSICTNGRHDPCVGLRGVPVAEAMMALVLMDQYLLRQAECHNTKQDIKKHFVLGAAR